MEEQGFIWLVTNKGVQHQSVKDLAYQNVFAKLLSNASFTGSKNEVMEPGYTFTVPRVPIIIRQRGREDA